MPYIVFPSFQGLPLPVMVRQSNLLQRQGGRTAGILGGLAPQSTSLFYKAATQYCLARNLPAFPRMVINSVDPWEVVEILNRKDMEGLYCFLVREMERIQGQVDFLAMACNSVHAVLEPLRERFSIPIIAIYEEVCKEVALAGLRKVGILGTKTTVDNCFYQKELGRYGIGYAVLPPEQEAAFDAFIFEEMLYGRGEGNMKRLILEGIRVLVGQGCEGVILACTELPLFIAQEDTDVPLFSSTHVLAHAVVKECYRRG